MLPMSSYIEGRLGSCRHWLSTMNLYCRWAGSTSRGKQFATKQVPRTAGLRELRRQLPLAARQGAALPLLRTWYTPGGSSLTSVKSLPLRCMV